MPDKQGGRGFAGMDREKQKEIASKGGRAAHAKGTAHEFTPDEARTAGAKGGRAAHARGTAHEFTPEEARAAGAKGGAVSGARRSRENGEREVEFVPSGTRGSSQPSNGVQARRRQGGGEG